MADRQKNKRSKIECKRCHTIISNSNRSHEQNCDRFWNLLTKNGRHLFCSFCDKSYSNLTSAFRHTASSHYNSNSLKNLVNLRNNEEKRLEGDEDEDDNWSDIEFDDGEVDKEQSLLLTTSINVKENLIDTPAPIRKLNTKAKRNKKEDGVMVIDVEDEDWDVPELDSEDATLNEKDNNVVPNVEKEKSKQAKLQRKRKSNDLSSR